MLKRRVSVFFGMIEQMENNFYKLSGLLAFLIAWAGMLTAIFTQGINKQKSISLHTANSRKTIILLAILSPLSMLLFMIFTIRWMAPVFDLPLLFIALSMISFAGYILAAWFPAVGGMSGKLHDIFAYGASLLLIPISFILATSPNISLPGRFMNVIACVIMIGSFGILLWYKPARKSYLYYQITYFLIFDLSLLAAGYIR